MGNIFIGFFAILFAWVIPWFVGLLVEPILGLISDSKWLNGIFIIIITIIIIVICYFVGSIINMWV
jgi:hypothetical protein